MLLTVLGYEMQKFGGPWTKQKLDLLADYLTSYNKVLSNQRLSRWYVDGFAGSGYSVLEREQEQSDTTPLFGQHADAIPADGDEVLDGSPLIALKCQPQFHRLRFIDAKKANIESLAGIVNANDDFKRRAQLVHGDANEHLSAFCNEMHYSWRAVVFLDPFATAVEWKTMEALAATQKCDVWILVPLGAMNRLLTKDGQRDPTWSARLTRIFGTAEWEQRFYRASYNLFDDDQGQEKVTDAHHIATYYRERLTTIFKGGVAKSWKTFRNSNNSTMFALMFALGNPSPAAKRAALGIANHLLDRV